MSKTLVARSFVATTVDIEAITQAYLDARSLGESSRWTYLKAFVATMQAEMDSAPRQRSTKVAKLSEEDIAAHMKVFFTVHKRFYTVVLTTVKSQLKTSEEVNSATNFARSAKSTLKGFIKRGGDIRALAACSVTKAALRADAKPATRAPAPFERRASRFAKRLEGFAKEYMRADKQAAVTGLNGIIGLIAAVVAKAEGVIPVKDTARAIRERRAFKVDGTMFVPMPTADTPVVRAA